MPRYFVRLSYKGTAYSGWQIQDNAVTVQGKVNETLSVLAGTEVSTTGCGRTDTGVHATRFYAHFDLPGPIGDLSRFLYSANAILPEDIVFREIFRVEDTAHARFDASKRTYEYRISTTKNPFLKDLSYQSFAVHDIERMNSACNLMIGTHDFSCFARTHSGSSNPVCTVYEAYWRAQGDILIFTISANRFLRNMVRAVVGTMLEIGSGKQSADSIPELIRKGERSEAGASAPASGLYLCEVVYPFITNPGKGSFFDI
jgi:tRNA pseudouridine38-40 synthase